MHFHCTPVEGSWNERMFDVAILSFLFCSFVHILPSSKDLVRSKDLQIKPFVSILLSACCYQSGTQPIFVSDLFPIDLILSLTRLSFPYSPFFPFFKGVCIYTVGFVIVEK